MLAEKRNRRPAIGQEFQIFDLPLVPPATLSAALALSNPVNLADRQTHIVGYSSPAGPSRRRAELWIKLVGPRAVIRLDPPDLQTRAGSVLSGISSTAANGLSKDVFPSRVVGVVTVVSANPDGGSSTRSTLPIVWERDRTFTLPTLGGPVAEARDANDSGQIVGWSARFDGIQRAVRWTITGPGTATVQDLGTLSPAGGRSQAVAINERGQIAGWAETASGVHHAFLWTQGGTEGPAFNSQMRDLGGPAVATDVNERGHVCGAILSGLPLILTRPFIWTPDERMVQLPADTIGNTFGASAAGINDDDVIVGQSGGRAVLWRGNGMEDLNGLITPDSGWFLIQALAVNRSREIVGYGAKNGEVRGWFLAPIF